MTQGYKKLLDDILYAVSIFYSSHMSKALSVFDQPLCMIAIMCILLGITASLQQVSHHSSESLWNDIVSEWTKTVTRTVAFLTLQFAMDILRESLNTREGEQNIFDVFIVPFLVLFMLIAVVKYIVCISMEMVKPIKQASLHSKGPSSST